ncbi:MAG TPA: thermonuclease family protein [Candidatus Angelobacter sp.]|nr:thermonuclease family protein [Candidatus Angelobacter sp.]
MSKVQLVGLVLCFLFLGACRSGPQMVHLNPPSLSQKNVIRVSVLQVVDGDTIKVNLNGREETVRVLLIDTPETHHPKLGIQPYGPEASAETNRLLDNKQVTLELAENQGRDKYGRLLAYLFVGGESVEVDLLKKGLARVAYVIPPNTKYLKTYNLAEAIAKRARLGVWKTKGYVEADGFHPEMMKARPATSLPDMSTSGFTPDSKGGCGGEIKGNSSKRGNIYHVVNDPFYVKTKAERCFHTEQEAEQAGFRSAK